MRLIPIVVLLVSLSGCVQSRISSELKTSGLDAKRAECVGGELSSKLSVEQSQALAAAVKATPTLRGKALSEVGASDLASVAIRNGDPETIAVTAQAAIKCNLV